MSAEPFDYESLPKAPPILVAVLREIDNGLGLVAESVDDAGSPFQNTCLSFECDTFTVRSCYWGDDPEEQAKPNFVWQNVKVWWYKRLGRDTRVNREIGPVEANALLLDCLAAIERMRAES
jgi:hypothetical protein